MAQRRVNLPFVGFVLAGIVVVGVGLLALKLLTHKDPKALAHQAEEAHKSLPGEEGLHRATEYMTRAVALAPHDASLRLQYAGYLHQLGTFDENAKTAEFQQYQEVLKDDPTNKDALTPMLHAAVEGVQFMGRPADFTRLRETAERVLKINEQDPRFAKDAKERADVMALRREAEAYQHIAVVAAWIKNIVTPESVLNEHMKALDEMLKADLIVNEPARYKPDIPYYLCVGYWKQSVEARTLGNDESKAVAAAKEKLAYETFDNVVKKTPDNVSMNVRFYQVLRSFSAGAEEDDGMHSDRPDYVKRMYELLSHARDVIHAREVELIANKQPEDPETSDAYLCFSEFLARSRDKLNKDGKLNPPAPKPAEVLAEFYQLRPEDQDARLSYARALGADRTTRAQAIELLQKDIVDRAEKSALRYRDKHGLEVQTYSLLVDLLVESCAEATEPTKHAELRKQAQDACQKLAERDRDSGGYLTALYRGEISLLTDPGTQGAIEAIPDLERARDLRKQLRGGKDAEWKLEWMLADAYRRGNQTGLAKDQLIKVIHYWPEQVAAHKALARLMVSQGQADVAADEIREVKRLEKDAAKDDRELLQLETALMVINPKQLKATDVDKALATMPEANPADVKRKIQVCLVEQKYDEAIRLYEKMRTNSPEWPGPSDLETVRSLVQLYMSQGKRDMADKVVADGLAKKPDDIGMQIVRAQLDKDMPKVIELTLKGIDSIKDPFAKEMAYYEFYRAQNKATDAMAHLDAAQKIDPDNARILDLRFQQAIMEHKYADAEAQLPKLAEKNYDEAHGLIYRYRLAMVRDNLQAADQVVQEMLDTLPQYARSWVYAGDLLQRERKYSDAVAKYNEALSRQSGNADALRGLVTCFLSMQPARPDDAWTYIQQGRKLYPNDAQFKESEINWELAYAPEKAIAPREAEAKASPDKIGVQIALNAAYWELAKAKLQKNKPDEAADPLQKAHDGFAKIIAKWPGENEIAYAYFGDICAQANDFAGGEKALKEFAAAEKWKDSPRPVLMLAGYYARAGKADLAEAAYTEALARSHNAPEVRASVAQFYRTQGKFDKAIASMDTSATDRATQEQLVHLYLEAGKLTDADQLMAKLLKANPKDAMLLVTAGMIQLQEQKYPDALASLKSALDVDPRNSPAYYYQGLIHLRQGPAGLQAAIKDFKQARDLAEGTNVAMQVQARMMLGEAERANGDQDAGATELASALALQPGDKNLRMRLIEMLGTLVTPRWGEVDSYIHQAQQMTEFKGDPDWYRVEATMWAQQKKDDKALKAITQALEMAKGQPTKIVPLMQDYVGILTRLERFPQLAAETDELMKKPEIMEGGWWVFQAHGTALARQGKKAEALGDYDKALAITAHLHNDEATMQVVQTVADTIGLDEAIKRLEEQAKGGDDRWRVIMVDLYLRKGDNVHAEAKADAVVAAANDGTLKADEKRGAYTVGGMAYMSTGKYDKAIQVYEKLLQLVPEDTVAMNNLACIWVDYNNPPNPAKALGYSTKAVEIIQKDGISAPDLLDTHGWVLTNNGRIDEGIAFLQQALERRPLMEGYYHLGSAYLKKNLGPEAQVQLTKAQRMLDDRKHRGAPVDAKFEAALAEALTKAKAMVNGSSVGTLEPSKS